MTKTAFETNHFETCDDLFMDRPENIEKIYGQMQTAIVEHGLIDTRVAKIHFILSKKYAFHSLDGGN